MTLNLVLFIGMLVCYACGVYLLLERSFTRIVLGTLLIGNATNLLIFLTVGNIGATPLAGQGHSPEEFTDPLPQAFILTAIVITFATTAFMLALLYRSWRIAREDSVRNDDEAEQLRETDPEADDEVFEPEEVGDTEFADEGADEPVAESNGGERS